MGKYGAYTLAQYRAKLYQFSRLLPANTARWMQLAGEKVAKEAREGHLSGPRMPRGVTSETSATLDEVTGEVKRAVRTMVIMSGKKVAVRVGAFGGHAGYVLGVHESGPHLVVPTRGPYMSYLDRGSWWRSKMVVIPGRPVLRPSLHAKRKEALIELLKGWFDAWRAFHPKDIGGFDEFMKGNIGW